jgi:hypothetical protein
MKKTFSNKTIGHVALAARSYKKVWVTTEGQVFTVEADAEEAVRVKNMIIDEPDDYVGLIAVTEDMVTKANLLTFGKDPEAFGKLFDNARIPRTKASKNGTFEKKREPKLDVPAQDAAEIAAALAGGETAPEKPKVVLPTPNK